MIIFLAPALLLLQMSKIDLLRPLSDGWREITTGVHTQARTDSYVEDVAFTPDGQVLIAASQHDGVQFRRLADGQVLHTFGRVLRHATLAGDGTLLATQQGSGPMLIKIWQTGNDQTPIQTLTSTWAGGMAFAPDNQQLAIAGATNVQVWSVAEGTLVHTLAVEGATVAFTPDGQFLTVGIPNKGVQLWRRSDWTQTVAVAGWGTFLALAPDGQIGAVPATVDQGTILLWRTSDGAILHTLTGVTGQIQALTFSPSGTVLASSDGDGGVQVWDVRNGALLQTLTMGASDSVGTLAFSPDGQTLAMGSYQTLRLWTLPGPIAQPAKHP